MIRSFAVTLLASALCTLPGQVVEHSGPAANRPIANRSDHLTVDDLSGVLTLDSSEFKAIKHVSVTVHNAHTNQDETYSGVPVKDIFAMIPRAANGPQVQRAWRGDYQILVGIATDNYHVALTVCDIDPTCRSGQAIVADSMNDAPLTSDGAFKLILTEDKKPARWVRNLYMLKYQTVRP